MARKLPWNTAAQPATANTRATAPRGGRVTTRRPRLETTDAEDPATARAGMRNPLTTPRKKRKHSRTPSTSPPPGPAEVAPMTEGFDEDDIWMMVEDEFQSVAQSFTNHLHHAEYHRLKRIARERPPKALPQITSLMSVETKCRLKRETRISRQRDALGTVGAQPRALADAEEDEKIDDPWRGTHLARLVVSGSQEKKSLKGLEKMPSSTRAAKGYSRYQEPRKKKDVGDFFGSVDLNSTKRKTDLDSDDDFVNSGASRSTRKLQSPLSPSSDEEVELGKADKPILPMSKEQAASTTSKTAPQGPFLPPKLKKKQVKEEMSIEDRLAAVPMFLT